MAESPSQSPVRSINMYRIHNRRARRMTRGVNGGWKNNLNFGESGERIRAEGEMNTGRAPTPIFAAMRPKMKSLTSESRGTKWNLGWSLLRRKVSDKKHWQTLARLPISCSEIPTYSSRQINLG